MTNYTHLTRTLFALTLGVYTLLVSPKITLAENLDNGVYININAGPGGQLSFDNLSGGLASSLNVGYNFNTYLAIDVGINSLSALGTSGINSSKIYTVAGKTSLPIGNIFYFYGRLGLGYENSSYLNAWDGTNEYNAAVALIAGGAAFHLGKHFELHLENSFFTPLNNQAPATTTNMLQLGLQYNF